MRFSVDYGYRSFSGSIPLSSSIARPKVFRVPAAKRESKNVLHALYAWGKNNGPIVRTCSVLAALTVVFAIISNQHDSTMQHKTPVSKEKFTLFGPSESNAATLEQPFVISGKNESIVGQITEMPAESKELDQIKTTTDVDKTANRDLLSVVNKH